MGVYCSLGASLCTVCLFTHKANFHTLSPPPFSLISALENWLVSLSRQLGIAIRTIMEHGDYFREVNFSFSSTDIPLLNASLTFSLCSTYFRLRPLSVASCTLFQLPYNVRHTVTLILLTAC